MVVADKLDQDPTYNHSNYWSPLACLVNEQETEENSHLPQIEKIAAMSTIVPSCPQNKIVASGHKKNPIVKQGSWTRAPHQVP
jgi:hypothetical protein